MASRLTACAGLASEPSKASAADLFAALLRTSALAALRPRLAGGEVLCLEAIARPAHPFLAAALRHLCPGRPILFVTDELRTQETVQQDLQTWLAEGPAAAAPSPGATTSDSPSPSRPSANLGARASSPVFFPSWEMLPHETKLPHADVIGDRLETLVRLMEARAKPATGSGVSGAEAGLAPVVIASVTALMQKTFPAAELAARTRRLQRGDRVDPLDLIEWLEEQGYEPEVQVNHRGEIALRGGIVDIFPLTSPWPVRLEFFGDELESLRTFDPITQMSRDGLESIAIPPGGELGILKRLAAGTTSPDFATLLDYLPSDTLVVLSEPILLDERAAGHAELVPEGDPFHETWAGLQAQLRERGLTVVTLSEAGLLELTTPLRVDEDGPALAEGTGVANAGGAGGPVVHSLEAYRPITGRAMEPQIAEAQRREFFAQLHRWLRQGYAVHVFCNNDGERQRFGEIWADCGFGPAAGGKADRPQVRLGALSRGFLFEAARLVVVTDAEVFGRYKVQRPRRLKSPHAQTSRSLLEINFSDLQEGDYVVHLEHGIGRYVGLQMMPLGGGAKPLQRAGANDAMQARQECLVIEYAAREPDQPAPRLYVPVSEAHLVSKYIGAGKARPVLNTLGGGRWQKTKEQAERAVRDLAAELLTIQAARASQPGHTFKPDTAWQREFESSFLYEETPDQWRAIVDTKRDMETARPMDRLICGDVGYGKTEVAIRAAFKAVMDGRQVAVLVPTTVLAQQHFNNFRERMADYPVRVELLSRFRKPREQRKVLEDLALGSVDIVIGTHRLVQKDIAFKDLGLVVIDEEQRFGVMHKERFKMLRQMVDVLTLSATPIPRTLHLALTGARDMSVIETPPQDRLPVETVVCEYDERIIRDAILRELGRGGQVFFLHNRVMDILTVASRLQALVPKARLLVGHGQMDPDDLEEVMTKFINGEADILLSTTIIESGIDIPNANTIIIDRADRFGLSDLYQLRGRVGRYKHQAYAYLLIPRHARMLTDARKRISAIKQYSSLGSGFKIAMRDLEIRGAGNMLGAQQSGHITAVGFELYCQLLKQSVAALKGETVRPRVDVQVRFDFLSLHPGDDAIVAAGPKGGTGRGAGRGGGDDELPDIQVPRETATVVTERSKPKGKEPVLDYGRAHAFLPQSYVSDPKLRIETYRRFAEIMDEEGVTKLKGEMRDRFGPLPAAVELLLQVAHLRVLAAARGITGIESREDKLMLTRRGDFIQVGGRFPRLTKREPRARLNEVKKLLQLVH